MLSQGQIEQFNRDGFLRGAKVLSDDEVETLRSELTRVAAFGAKSWAEHDSLPLISNIGGDEGHPILQIVNIWEASPAFESLVHNRKITEQVAQLTQASELRIWHDQIQYKPAETGGVNMWHQDAPLWPCVLPMTEVSAWVALDDVDEGNGCMSMVPGSHLWGDQIPFLWTVKDFNGLPEEFEGHKIEVRKCPVNKGEVHFHHGLTWHGSHANTSDRPRRAIAMHYMTEEAYFAGNHGHPMERWMEYEADAKLEGQHFPLVWAAEPVGAR